MKTVISPTCKPDTLSFGHPTVTIEYSTDDVDIDEFVAYIVYPLFLAWGYGEESIKNSIGERG